MKLADVNPPKERRKSSDFWFYLARVLATFSWLLFIFVTLIEYYINGPKFMIYKINLQNYDQDLMTYDMLVQVHFTMDYIRVHMLGQNGVEKNYVSYIVQYTI